MRSGGGKRRGKVCERSSKHPGRQNADPHTIPRLIKAMPNIPVRRIDSNRVPQLLQRDGRVDDQALGAADAEVWVKEDDVLLFLPLVVFWGLGRHYSCSVV